MLAGTLNITGFLVLAGALLSEGVLVPLGTTIAYWVSHTAGYTWLTRATKGPEVHLRSEGY